jgi:hypothetical protein
LKKETLLLFLILFAAGQTYSEGANDLYLPYHGKSVKVGMSTSELGSPEKTEQKIDEEYGKPIFRSTFKDGLVIDTLAEQKDVIVRIILTDPSLVLSNGLRTGIAKDEVIKKMGKPSSKGTFKGRKYISYDFATEYHEVLLILNAFLDSTGKVVELRLVMPGD